MAQQNDVQFYKSYFTYLSDTLLNATDSTDLYTLASGCPSIHGSIVYQARSLYCQIYGDIYLFNDEDCVANNSQSRLAHFSEEVVSSDEFKQIPSETKIYPNPANDRIFIVSSDDEIVYEMTLTDVHGKTIEQITFGTKNFVAEIGLNLINGIYFVYLKDGRGLEKRSKLVIAK